MSSNKIPFGHGRAVVARSVRMARGVVLTLLALACAATSLHAQQRRRVAVMTFDVGQDLQQKASQQFAIREDLGRKLSDLLVTKLVNDGAFILIERSALDKILKEQNLSNSDRNDPATAAKIGKIAGVDAIIIGSITAFSKDQQDSQNNVGSVLGGRFSGLKVGQKTVTVKVAVSARVVDTSTAEILAAATGLGDSSKKSSQFQTASQGNGGVGQSRSDTDSGGAQAEEATFQAINMMAMQLEASPRMAPTAIAPPPPPAKVVYNGLVADVTGNAIIITVGAKSGVRVGDTVEITRPVRTVKNPQTGAVLKVVSEKLGEAKVTETDDGSATATYSGTAPLKVNDHVSSAP